MLSVRTMCVCRLCESYLFGKCVSVGCLCVICRTTCVCRLCERYLFGQCVSVACVNVICLDNVRL